MNSTILSTLNDHPPLTAFKLSMPKLTILTGENGAGKSRLLKGIADGKISYFSPDGKNVPKTEIRYIEQVGFSFHGKDPTERNLDYLCRAHGVSIAPINSHFQLVQKDLSGANAEKETTDGEKFELRQRIHGLIKAELDKRPLPASPGHLTNLRNAIDQCVRAFRANGVDIDAQEISRLVLRQYFPDFYKSLDLAVDDPLSLKLVSLFELWRRRYAENVYENFLHKEGDPTALPLSEEQFFCQYGPKPWEVLNQILKDSGTELRFKVDESKLRRVNKSYQNLMLEDKAGNNFPAEGISSGERVIFQVAMSRYISEADKIDCKKPKLILFDEPDAHLHPSLANRLLKTFKHQFVDQGINIIISTHSPTTVGLADEGSIVFMRSHEQPKITSRRAAINALLSGQEKLFIDLSGARIVFVEDATDVDRLEQLCSVLDLRPSGQALIFRSISKKVPAGTIDGGKGRVRELLKKLGDDRNILGLIDYDNKECPSDGVRILCENERYGIENLLLDPRILVCFLLREDTPSFAKKFGLDIKTYQEFDRIPDSKMQECINKVQCDVLGGDFGELKLIQYEDGKRFIVCTNWLLKRCHDLESEVESKYRLRAKCQGGDPLARICAQTIPEKPGLMPLSFRKSIDKLGE